MIVTHTTTSPPITAPMIAPGLTEASFEPESPCRPPVAGAWLVVRELMMVVVDGKKLCSERSWLVAVMTTNDVAVDTGIDGSVERSSVERSRLENTLRLVEVAWVGMMIHTKPAELDVGTDDPDDIVIAGVGCSDERVEFP